MMIYSELANLTLSVKRLHEPIENTYACERCGRRDALDAVVPDERWEKISGRSDGGGLLCLWCMDELADRRDAGGEVRLHFCGKALYGSSGAYFQMWDEVWSAIRDYRQGELGAADCVEAIVNRLTEYLPGGREGLDGVPGKSDG